MTGFWQHINGAAPYDGIYFTAERNRQKVEQAERKLPPTKANPKAPKGVGSFGKPAGLAGPPPKPKDPLKTLGQKSNIKLTLIKVGSFILDQIVTLCE